MSMAPPPAASPPLSQPAPTASRSDDQDRRLGSGSVQYAGIPHAWTETVLQISLRHSWWSLVIELPPLLPTELRAKVWKKSNDHKYQALLIHGLWPRLEWIGLEGTGVGKMVTKSSETKLETQEECDDVLVPCECSPKGALRNT